jgi:hypothetical protein
MIGMKLKIEKWKDRLRSWVYRFIFSLLSGNRIKRESLVLGIIIGYINPNATRSAVQYLISDLPKGSIDESMVLNGVLMSGYLIPARDVKFCSQLAKVDTANARECNSIKSTFLRKLVDITSSIEVDSLLRSINILLKNKSKLSNIAV